MYINNCTLLFFMISCTWRLASQFEKKIPTTVSCLFDAKWGSIRRHNCMEIFRVQGRRLLILLFCRRIRHVQTRFSRVTKWCQRNLDMTENFLIYLEIQFNTKDLYSTFCRKSALLQHVLKPKKVRPYFLWHCWLLSS